MEIGISTACFYPMHTEDTISIIRGLGAGLCEVFFEAECEYESEFTSLLSEKMKEFKVLAGSVHALCINFEQQLFSDYDRRRNDALSVYKKVMEAACAIGAKSYTFHGDKRTESIDKADFRHYGLCFDELLRIADSYGVSLAWENVAWCQSSRPQFISNVLCSVKQKGMKFTLDIKQANRAKVNVDEYISVMGKDIVNVHINDFNSESTCLIPGKGNFDFSRLFSKLSNIGYSGDAILEVYSTNYTSIEELGGAYEYVKEKARQMK